VKGQLNWATTFDCVLKINPPEQRIAALEGQLTDLKNKLKEVLLTEPHTFDPTPYTLLPAP
jgi:hypothetical protein